MIRRAHGCAAGVGVAAWVGNARLPHLASPPSAGYGFATVGELLAAS